MVIPGLEFFALFVIHPSVFVVDADQSSGGVQLPTQAFDVLGTILRVIVNDEHVDFFSFSKYFDSLLTRSRYQVDTKMREMMN